MGNVTTQICHSSNITNVKKEQDTAPVPSITMNSCLHFPCQTTSLKVKASTDRRALLFVDAHSIECFRVVLVGVGGGCCGTVNRLSATPDWLQFVATQL